MNEPRQDKLRQFALSKAVQSAEAFAAHRWSEQAPSSSDIARAARTFLDFLETGEAPRDCRCAGHLR
jgi:hypothetical protein